MVLSCTNLVGCVVSAAKSVELFLACCRVVARWLLAGTSVMVWSVCVCVYTVM